MNLAEANDAGEASARARRAAMRRYALLVLLPALAGALFLAWASVGHEGVPRETPVVAAAPAWTKLQAPLPRFLLQLMLVLALAKSAGWALRRMGQPGVIGEMLAGILLGPSLLGLLFPEAHAWLFPPGSLSTLGQISQLGVLVFMFAAGAEFNLSHLRGQRSLAIVVGHAGIALPFCLGLILAWLLHAHYAPAGVGLVPFALFVGVALSVTAFPVLLRIIEERGYGGRRIATVAVACAALSDASAWAILGAIVAWVQSQGIAQLAANAALALAFVWLLLRVLRPRLSGQVVGDTQRAGAMIALILGALACALITELLGLHLLFGAFLAGVAVSSSADLRRIVEQRIEPFAVVLLLPLFFASTGLITRIDLLSGREWLLCLAIIAIATVGKLGGTVLAARTSGMPIDDSLRLGALMNTRGLMELIVLALGFELGLIEQRLYAVLVVVAIVTTVMTGPLLSAIDRWAARRVSERVDQE